MKNKFFHWLKARYKNSTAYNYSIAIDRISRHYSGQAGRDVDIFKVKDIQELNGIAAKYTKGGMYELFGDYGNGTNRAAIKRYIEFMSNYDVVNQLNEIKESNDTLKLFPNYKIMQNGIAYKFNYKVKILENNESNMVIAVMLLEDNDSELESFGQICACIAKLTSQYPGKNISGIIVAKEVGEDLKNASSLIKNLSIKLLKIKIEMEDIL